jgi:hypothetical protein
MEFSERLHPAFPPARPTHCRFAAGSRGDLLAMWEEPAFSGNCFQTAVSQTDIRCNSPDPVQFAFNTKNASFERKVPRCAMRRR